MRTVLIVSGTLLLLNVLICGGELLHAVETAQRGFSDAVGAGAFVPLIDRGGQALFGLLTAPPSWKLLLGGLLLHLSFRV